MPGRNTQQNLRNFVLRLEPLAVVNAELLFSNIKIGRERTRSALSLTAALGQTETRAHRRGMSVQPPGADMSMTGLFAPIADDQAGSLPQLIIAGTTQTVRPGSL
jgi:hypothetical protein